MRDVKNKKIAVLGATGHIAKGLIYNFYLNGIEDVFLFARSKTRLLKFLSSIRCEKKFIKRDFEKFPNYKYDVVINCVGLGSPLKVKDTGAKIFELTEEFDSMVLNYLKRYPNTLYISFSSGAAFGTEFKLPVGNDTYSKWNINNIQQSDYYGIAKFYSEVKHRSLKNLNIVDLRVFGYFSRFIDLDASYLLSEIILCMKNKERLVTNSQNIIRDFVHPEDIFSLIKKCILKENINEVFDVYSKKPVSKFEILNFFEKNYGLKYKINKKIKTASVTGVKINYYSKSRKAEKIGYRPKFTSINCIAKETKELLEVRDDI